MTNPNLSDRQFESVPMAEVHGWHSEDFFPHKMGEIHKFDRSLQLGRRYDEGGFEELRRSIRENGVQTPISAVRYPSGMVDVKNGNHRYLAAHAEGLTHIPVEFTPHEEYVQRGYKVRGQK